MGLKDIAKTYRLQNNINQKSMAALVGCSQATYCKFEAGKQQLREAYLLQIHRIIFPSFLSLYLEHEAKAELYLTGSGVHDRVKNNQYTKGRRHV